MSFRFAQPEWLWLLAAVALLAWWRGRRDGAAAVRFSSVALVKAVARPVWLTPGRLLPGLTLLALALLALAAARPQLGEGETTVEASGVDIVLAVDVSASMLALDFAEDRPETTRLDAVKEVVDQFIGERAGDRVGLVVFGEDAWFASPLTLNHEWLRQNVARLAVGLVPPQGTAIGMGLANALNRLRDLPDSKSKIVILLSDGENNAGEIPPLEAARLAQTLGVKVYTIAAGSGGRVRTLLYDEQTRTVRRDRFGRLHTEIVQYEVDETTLREMADITGGKFFRAREPDELRKVYEEINQLEKTERELVFRTVWQEAFQWPAGLALTLGGLAGLLRATWARRLP